MKSRIISTLVHRLQLAQFGVYFLRSSSIDLSNLKIGNRRFNVAMPKSEEHELRHELREILVDDCYRLGKIKKPIASVLDIGANVGIFSIAARHHFPSATIHMYEPNRAIEEYLKPNSSAIDTHYYLEAVGVQGGNVTLDFKINSLHTTAVDDRNGKIPRVSFSDAIRRIGGKVDLVKLDCEGGEWEIFEDIESWAKVTHLTMEYHLWARPELTVADVFRVIEKIGFGCWSHTPHAKGKWGLIQASRN